MRTFLLACLLAGCGVPKDADGDGSLVTADCDDNDADVNSSAVEVCDGRDNDCDGHTDDETAVDATTWYLDFDGDGFGGEEFTLKSCQRPEGYLATAGDCDDGLEDVHPDADERCDYMDNDCDGSTDEDDAIDEVRWYEDADRDGHGSTDSTTSACAQPTGYVATANDCDDADPTTNASADEVCDLADNDCDGQIDEDDAVDAGAWYSDLDGDGYGSGVPSVECVAPANTSADAGDCNDSDDDVNPERVEACDDGIDNDCDGTANDCAIEGVMALDGADAILAGVEAYDAAGTAVAGIGDVDGDGYGDVLIGVPGDDTRGSAAGAAVLVRGPISGERSLSDADATLTGDKAGDKAGTSVGLLGDVDGDGYAELYIGSPAEDSAGTDAGVGYMAYGPVSGSYKLVYADVQLYGESAGDGAGGAIASAGDVDADGVVDMLIGATGDDDESADSGAAYVVLGPPPAEISLDQADAKLLGYGDDAGAGQAVSGNFDMDGDGYGDLVVAAPYDAASADYAGAVYVLEGPVSGTVSLPHDAMTLWGEAEGDAAGYNAVACVGDVDGDGLDDVVIGAYGYDDGYQNVGIAYLLHGPILSIDALSLADAALVGEEAQTWLGASVARAGDVDRDGYDDVLVGAIGDDEAASDAGAAYLVYGPMEGWLKTDTADLAMRGTETSDRAGSSVSGAEDVNGDGFADVLIGGTSAASDAGAVWLVLGHGM